MPSEFIWHAAQLGIYAVTARAAGASEPSGKVSEQTSSAPPAATPMAVPRSTPLPTATPRPTPDLAASGAAYLDRAARLTDAQNAAFNEVAARQARGVRGRDP